MRDQNNTLATIGLLVVLSQTVERMLNMLLTFVIQDGEPLTYERLMRLDETHHKKTLGFFIREMRKRASFEDTLDATLERFLKSRNQLIHHFGEVPGSELATEADLEAIGIFLHQLYSDLSSVLVFCGALIHAWTQQSGVAKEITDEAFLSETNEYFARIKHLSPLVDGFIFAKEKND
jgi:hypothetical protein